MLQPMMECTHCTLQHGTATQPRCACCWTLALRWMQQPARGTRHTILQHGTAKQLLLDHGSNMDAADGYRNQAHLIAAQRGHIGALQLLISRGVCLKDCGRAVLTAVREGHLEAATMLLRLGADMPGCVKIGEHVDCVSGFLAWLQDLGELLDSP